MGSGGRSDEQRWAEAFDVLNQIPNAPAEQRQRRTRRWLLILMIALILVSVLGGFLIALLADPDPARSADPEDVPLVQQILGLGFVLVGTVIIGFGIFKLVRAGQWGSRWKAPTAALSHQQRKGLMKQIRGRAPVDQEHLAITRDLAERVLLARWQMVLGAGGVTSYCGVVIGSPSPWRLGVLLALLVVLNVGVGFSIERNVIQARRFLAENPADRLEADAQ